MSADTGRAIVPATRPITIRDLLTHTSGISYGTDRLVAPLYEAERPWPRRRVGMVHRRQERACVRRRWNDSRRFHSSRSPARRGYTATASTFSAASSSARRGSRSTTMCERTSPVRSGMHDTYFFLPPAKRERLAAVYRTDSSGHAERAPNGPRGQGDYVDGPRKNFSGGAGMVSTAADYARFLEAIRRGGAIDGVRILSPHAVELMHTNMVGRCTRRTVSWALVSGSRLSSSTAPRAWSRRGASAGAEPMPRCTRWIPASAW